MSGVASGLNRTRRLPIAAAKRLTPDVHFCAVAEEGLHHGGLGGFNSYVECGVVILRS